MRSIHAAFVAVVLAVAPAPVHAKLAVVATTPDLGAIARAVGGSRIEVTAIARPTEDPHFVDAKPSYAKLLNQADVLIEGGAGLESGWLPPMLETARNPKLAPGATGRIVGSTGVTLLDVPAALSRAQGDVHPTGNPHYLLDPVNGGIVAGTIADALAAADPDGAASYRERLATFRTALAAKLPEWERAMAPRRGTKLVTYHKNFDYFAQRFGLEIIANLEPKPGIPPSPAHVATLIPLMQQASAKLIVIEPNRERQVADFVAQKTGATVLTLPLMPGIPEAAEYLDLIDLLVRRIAGAPPA